jgi:hypothetical protein
MLRIDLVKRQEQSCLIGELIHMVCLLDIWLVKHFAGPQKQFTYYLVRKNIGDLL